MRIAFTGSHRVGKTSLATAITAYLPHYDFIEEPYLQMESKGYLFPEIPATEDYVSQFRHSLQQIANSAGNIIFDRCPLDLLAYIYVTDKNKNIEIYYQEMLEAMEQIDLLVFVPVETPDRVLVQQSDLPRVRLDVDEVLQEWMDDLDNDIITVSGSISDRLLQAQQKIQSML
ncbi:MAG: AAA family ATPase [Taibaiella sp.]|nr:AAA family ATPase [Taibaiella sp.]